MNTITYNPIGIIHTPFQTVDDAPSQPDDVSGTIEILPELAEGLQGLDGFSHLVLIYHLHKSQDYRLKIIPRHGDAMRGVFATRSPNRPNPIGIAIVALEYIDNNILYIKNVDMLDNTPLLDIKPYIPSLDNKDIVISGWLDKNGKQGR